MSVRFLLRLCLLAGCVLAGGCASINSYDGRGLTPGVSGIDDVLRVMGEPSARWTDADGTQQLAYPRGPMGTQTFMVFVDAQERLQRIEGVLDSKHFARIEPGKSGLNDVLRLLGPSPAQWITYFERRDELVWEWRICDDWMQQARFDVLFDATTGIVRSTYQRPEYHWPRHYVASCAP